jgi:hypothetical protein
VEKLQYIVLYLKQWFSTGAISDFWGAKKRRGQRPMGALTFLIIRWKLMKKKSVRFQDFPL